MKDLTQLKKETPLARRMLLKLAKVAVKSIPIIGPAYEMVDDVVLGSIAEQGQDRINSLVHLMYEKLEPLMRRLEKEDLPDEALERRLGEENVQIELATFAGEMKKQHENFEVLSRQILSLVGEHSEKIETLSREVAKMSESLDIGSTFKYIAPSVRHRISIRGNVKALYDRLDRSGGQGVLYRAHRIGTKSDKTVMVKGLKSGKEGDSRAVQRFLLEGFLASQIDHPNIVRVTDYGGFFESDEYFIEMEDLGSETLKSWSGRNPFRGDNLEEYIAMILQATQALEYIHGQNLVHRDIKPSNFMVIEDSLLKLIDFGCAKSLEAEENLRAGRTMTGEMIGTPQYMSPEQFDKSYAKISSATDVYCLGVTLFELFTGQLPYNATSAIGYGNAHTKQSPARPSSLHDKIPDGLDKLIQKMMSKRPEARGSLGMVRASLEGIRPDTMEKRMTQIEAKLKDSFKSGLSGESEKSILEAIKALESSMMGASPTTAKESAGVLGTDRKRPGRTEEPKGKGEHKQGIQPDTVPEHGMQRRAAGRNKPMPIVPDIVDDSLRVREKKRNAIPGRRMPEMQGKPRYSNRIQTKTFAVDDNGNLPEKEEIHRCIELRRLFPAIGERRAGDGKMSTSTEDEGRRRG